MTKEKVSSERTALSASQHDAIRLLVAGCTAKYTALVLKLNYADVRRWIEKDIGFQTELAAQAQKGETQSPPPLGQPKKAHDDKSRQADYEGDDARQEFASN
jgi:hypothetical protein